MILPSDKNRSLQDLTFERKLPIYFGENLLAKSLNTDCYINNPQFKRFYENVHLNFKPYDKFSKNSLNERQILYEEIVNNIWNVEKLEEHM